MRGNKKYQRISLAEREEISRNLAQGMSVRRIARQLKRHASSVSREVRQRGMDPMTYRAITAHQQAYRRASHRRRRKYKLAKNHALRCYIVKKLKLRWSPEQIVNAMKKTYPLDESMRISEETIYSYLYVLPKGQLKKQLLSMLRQGRKRRRRKGQLCAQPKPLKEMVSIEDRPAHIENRDIPGHWEGDILLGKNRQSSLGTLVERKTRFTVLVPLKNKRADTVRRAFEKEMNKLPHSLKKSLTYDQGREMADHQQFTQGTKMKVYFAHPASPWERGTNENTNGLVRQFFPKGTDFNTLHWRSIKYVERLLNGRPRRVLQFQTPYEVYQQVLR